MPETADTSFLDAGDPTVTLVVPVRNEEQHIDRCLAALSEQTYPRDRLRIVVVDGESTDATAAKVRDWASRDPRIELMSNPRRGMPDGSNIGIRAASSELVGVISGHSVPAADYVQRAVDALRRTGAASVGGRIVRAAESDWQRAIAVATVSRIGVGDSRHNYAETGQWVETVFPGMWRRSLFEEIGLFDTAMLVNEDNELSYRIRKAGGRIWFDPAVRVEYVPRGNLGELFTQYRRYGLGKVRVWRKHHGGIRWRHLVPPAWVALVVGGAALALVGPPLRRPWLAVVAAYAIVIGAASVRIAWRRASPLKVAAALVTLHAAYGIGVWQGILGAGRRT